MPNRKKSDAPLFVTEKTKERIPEVEMRLSDPDSQGNLTSRSAGAGVADQAVAGGNDSCTGKADIGPTADAEKTRRSLGKGDNIHASANYLGQLSCANLQSEITDEEALRRAGAGRANQHQKRIAGAPLKRLAGHVEGGHAEGDATLPAVIRREVGRTGNRGVPVPEWHLVRNLPGYLRSFIRGMGERIFRPFTDVPLDEIQVISTLLNSEKDVRSMMGFIAVHGRRSDTCELAFDRIMPGLMKTADELTGKALGGYRARVQIWNLAGWQFMFVQDHAGLYIYSYAGRDQRKVGDSSPDELMNGR
jgi:hypothetical protein